MNINIEKYGDMYKNFFQFSATGDTEKGRSSAGIWSVSYEKTGAKTSGAGFFGYDKSSNITDGTKELSASLTEENMNIMDFLNSAIDTLKNLVTDEDYSAFSELGITADKEDMTTLVTVYERIQIQLAAYGEGNATSLNINPEKIDKVIKSPALATSMKMAESIGDIDDGAKEYILKNNLEPTVKNVYMAVHSGEGNVSENNGGEMSDEQWKQLLPQVEKFLEKNGIDADEEALDSAKWLLEKDIPLTVDSLLKYDKLKEIETADTRDMENVKENMILSGVFGEQPENGYMTSGWIDIEAAGEAVEIIRQADEGAAYYIADENLTFNVSNLKKYIAYVNENNDDTENNYIKNNIADNNKTDSEADGKRKHILNILNEAKSVMTMAGAVIMEKLGIDVTYADIEDMVTEIKNNNNDYNAVFFQEPTEEKSEALTNIMEIMGRLSDIPVAAVGAVAADEQQFNVNNIYNEGIRLRLAYEKAGQTYEAVGTQVRGDLGDSIIKAFGNTDDLIEEAGLTPDDTYRRAVRVLGYNSMEISSENIIMIAEKTDEVDRVIKNITPKTASYLIENNINPLEENIEALNDRLEEINSLIGADENEEYSRYLWKLEKTGAVTKEERQAYIELYRAIKTIEKADTRAVGAVVSEGVAFTLGNLLSAEKSRNKYGSSTVVNDDTGYYQGRLVKNKLSDILEGIHGGAAEVTDSLLDEDINFMWETYASYDEQERIKALNLSYDAYRLNELYGEAAEYTEEMIYNLLDDGLAPNIENMYSIARLMKKNKDMETFFGEEINAEERLLDSFDGEQSISDTYKEIEADAEKLLENEMETETIESLKYKGLYNAAKYMSSAAQNRSYYIPVDMDGEAVLVKVKFLHEGADENSIKITAKDELTGKVEANIIIKDGALTGYAVCDNEELEEAFRDGMEQWQQETADSLSENEDLSDRRLYDISKSFLKMLKDFGRLPINNVG